MDHYVARLKSWVIQVILYTLHIFKMHIRIICFTWLWWGLNTLINVKHWEQYLALHCPLVCWFVFGHTLDALPFPFSFLKIIYATKLPIIQGEGRGTLHEKRKKENHEFWEFIFEAKVSPHTHLSRSCSRGRLREAVGRSLEGVYWWQHA